MFRMETKLKKIINMHNKYMIREEINLKIQLLKQENIKSTKGELPWIPPHHNFGSTFFHPQRLELSWCPPVTRLYYELWMWSILGWFD